MKHRSSLHSPCGARRASTQLTGTLLALAALAAGCTRSVDSMLTDTEGRNFRQTCRISFFGRVRGCDPVELEHAPAGAVAPTRGDASWGARWVVNPGRVLKVCDHWDRDPAVSAHPLARLAVNNGACRPIVCRSDLQCGHFGNSTCQSGFCGLHPPRWPQAYTRDDVLARCLGRTGPSLRTEAQWARVALIERYCRGDECTMPPECEQ